MSTTTTFENVYTQKNKSYLVHAGSEGGVDGDCADGVDKAGHEGGGGEGEEDAGDRRHGQQGVVAPNPVIDLRQQRHLQSLFCTKLARV